MVPSSRSILLSALLVLTGCGTRTVVEVPDRHPASPQAAAAPQGAPSTTLALPSKPDTGAPAAAVAPQPAGATGHDPAAQQWTCPMHEKVVQDKPGRCPKCGMDLVLKPAKL